MDFLMNILHFRILDSDKRLRGILHTPQEVYQNPSFLTNDKKNLKKNL